MKKFFRLLAVVFLVQSGSFAQTSQDSLRRVIGALPVDTASVHKLLRWSDSYILKDEHIAVQLAKAAYDMARQTGNKTFLFHSEVAFASRLLNQANYLEASAHLLEALRLAEELNSPEMIAKACNSLGNLYARQDQGAAALPYYTRALAYYKSVGNKSRMVVVLGNIGNTYYAKSTDKKNLALAADYYHQVMQLVRNLNDTAKLIDNANKMALVYTDMDKGREALALLNESRKMCEATADQYDLIYNYSYTGRAYMDLKMPDSSIFFLSKSIEIAKAMNDRVMIADASISMAESQALKKNYEKAYQYQLDYQSLHDSLLNSDNTRRIAEAQNRYESEKRDRQIEMLEMNAKQGRLITWALLGGSLLLLILALLMYSRYSMKNKSHKLLKQQNSIIAQKNKDITDSINYAKKIQDAMLPGRADIVRAFPQSFLIYFPKDIVSGDFYWFAERQDKLFIAAIDCTGHGVPGAFMSMIGNDMLYDAVAEKSLNDPGAILASLNQHVKKSLRQNESDSGSRDGMDAAFCVFDKSLKKMKFSGANRPLYLLKNGELLIIRGTKSSIGGHTDPGQEFQTLDFNLSPGDTVYIFSDGYCDQFGGSAGKKFTTKKLRDLLTEIKDEALDIQGSRLEEAFRSWKQHNEQVDDVLLIGIRI